MILKKNTFSQDRLFILPYLKMIKLKDIVLTILFLLIGFHATANQIIIVRELLAVLFGNELILALIFFWWFVSIALGSLSASYFPSIFRSHGFFILILIIFCLLPQHQIFLIRTARLTMGVSPGEWVPFSQIFIFSFIVIAPFSFIIGLLFPYCTVIFSKEENSKKRSYASAGLVYSIESLGSMIAGIFISLILLRFLDNATIILITTTLMFFTIIIYSSIFMEGRIKAISITAILIALVFTSAFSGLLDKKGLVFRWKNMTTLSKVYETNSIYKNISIGKSEEQYSIFGNGSYIMSFPDKHISSLKAHFITSIHPNPKRMLIFSEGYEEIIHDLLKHAPTTIDLVQIDSKLHFAIRKFLDKSSLSSLKDKRVSMHFADIRKFIEDRYKSGLKKYDIFVSFTPDPLTLNNNRFFTLEFFEDIKRILKSDGIFMFSVTSTENYASGDIGDYLGSVYKTAKEAFREVLVIPGSKTYIVCSQKENYLTYDLNTILKRKKNKGTDKNFPGERLSVFYQSDRIKRLNDFLDKNIDSYALNTDLKPITFLLSLKILGEYSGSISNTVFTSFQKLSFFHYIIFILFLIIARSAYIFFLKKDLNVQNRFNALLTIGSTGLVGFSLQLIMIYIYQSHYGYIYQGIGFIVGFFMLGLFIGSGIANKLLSNFRRDMHSILFMTETALCIFIVLIPFVFKLMPYELTVFSFSILSGALSGFEFPIANRIYFEESGLIKAASFLDSIDHLGAAFGSLICGIILLPTIGIFMTCILICIVKIGCLLLWGQFLYSKTKNPDQGLA